MGNDDGYDDHFDDDGFDDELDDDDGEPRKKKRIATSTKIVLVVAGWLLLTLFLIGEFSKDKTPTGDTASAQLDTVDSDGDGELDAEDDLFIDEEVALEEFDTDGDGVLSESERAAAVEAYEAAVASGEIVTGEPWKGVTGGAATATEEGTGESAMPGAGPTSGGSGSGSGTGSGSGSTGTGGGAGSTGSTTTTAASSGGGGRGATTTTTKGAAQSPTTTANPTTTTSPTTTSPPPPPPPPPDEVSESTIVVTGTPGAFILAPRSFTVAVGSKVRMQNSSNKDHKWKLSDRPEILVEKGTVSAYQTFNTRGTISYHCTIHDKMDGTITVE